jgi:hypothetical protein
VAQARQIFDEGKQSAAALDYILIVATSALFIAHRHKGIALSKLAQHLLINDPSRQCLVGAMHHHPIIFNSTTGRHNAKEAP